MNTWGVLGIEPTEDVSVIKKAYAKKLKLFHPEEDPQGFQRLREAYESALQYSKWMKQEERQEEQAESQADIFELPYANISPDISESPADIEALNDEFVKRAEDLYNNFFLRINIENWEELLDCDIMWNISNRTSLGYRLLDFLSGHHYLPREVWKLLDSNFNWRGHENFYYDYYEELICYIKLQVEAVKGLGYSGFVPVEGVDYETYLECREKAFNAVEENNPGNAYTYLNQAKVIYQGDPELLFIEGLCLIRTADINGALSAFNELLKIIPDHTGGLFCRAGLYYDRGYYQWALEDFLHVEACLPGTPDVQMPIAKCCYNLKKYEKAKEYFLKVLEANADNTEARDRMLQVNKQMINRLRWKCIKSPGNKLLKDKLEHLKVEGKMRKKEYKKRAPKRWEYFRGSYGMIAFAIFVLIRLGHIVAPDTVQNVNTAPVANPPSVVSLSNTDIETITIGMYSRTGFTDARISEVVRLNIFALRRVDGSGISTTFIPVKAWNEASVSSRDGGWVYVGKLNGKEVIFVSKQALAAEKMGSSSFSGEVCGATTDQIKAVKKELNRLGTSDADLVTNVFLYID